MFALTIASMLMASGDDAVTYNRDIAPIFYKHCASCHRPGEVGPFSLLDYNDAAKRASFIKEVTSKRQMPPWKAEPGYGSFQDELRLSDAQIQLIGRWVEGGCEQGDPSELPPAPTFADGWQLGEPDLVLSMDEAFEIPAAGDDIFRCFVIPTGLLEDRAVSAIDFRPGNRKAVHHALFFLDSRGQARRRDEADPGPGYASFGGVGILPTGMLGGWAPGSGLKPLPEGLARLMPGKSDLVLQIHYHPTGKLERDLSKVGLHFSKTPSNESRILTAVALLDRAFSIPPGDSSYKISPKPFVLPTSVQAIGITPHMHWIGKEMKVWATRPDGEVVPLIWIKDWDFNWQGNYLFAEPILLPEGTRIELTSSFDNSARNPRNPNSPPRTVTFGEQTNDEMCLCGIQMVPESRDGYVPLRRAALQYLLNSGRPRGPTERAQKAPEPKR